MPRSSKCSSKLGFSLTELSVVVVIIAILLAGILKGQNLINEAKLQAIVSEVSSHKVAVNSFYAKYAKYPGDFNEAVAYWGATTANGDNNGYIEFKNTVVTPVYEGYRLWQHLSYAGMVNSPYLGTATTSIPALGTDVPLSKSGGGYLFDYSSSGTTYNGVIGGAYGMDLKNVMILGIPIATVASPVKVNGVLTATQAMSLDTKMDDGLASSGNVEGSKGVGSASPSCYYATDGRYRISLSGADCIMIFNVSNSY